MLVFEAHNLNVEWYTKVPVAIQNAIHCYYVIYDEKRKKKTKHQRYYSDITGSFLQEGR